MAQQLQELRQRYQQAVQAEGTTFAEMMGPYLGPYRQLLAVLDDPRMHGVGELEFVASNAGLFCQAPQIYEAYHRAISASSQYRQMAEDIHAQYYDTLRRVYGTRIPPEYMI